MKKRFLWLIFLLCVSSVFAEEGDIFDPQAGKDRDQIFDQRENYFQTSTPYKITPKVNPITGDLIEEETDLVVAGNEPLSVRRFYNHSAMYEHKTGGWRYNPEFFFVANLEWPGQETFAAVGESSGSITPLKPNSNCCSFDPSKGFSQFEPNGQTHPLNTKINYYRVPGKDKGYFSWRGEILDGSGTKRYFDSGNHCWLNNLITSARRSSISGTIYVTMYTPNCWTPYQFHVYEERKPNGNIICYSTCRWKDGKYYPTPPLLSGITAYNADKSKVLGSISFHYNQDKHGDVRGFTAKGSDGRQVGIQHHGKSPFQLFTVSSPDKPAVGYGYQGTWVNRVEKADGRLITTEYSGDKVSAQYAPVGPNGEMHPIGRYIYHDRDTEVYDAEGNKTIYKFNENKQLLSLEIYKDNAIYRIDRFAWDTATGNLLKKTIEDGSGNVFQTTEYAYDKNHNPIVERNGDGKHWRIINRTFSDDGFNLKLSESDRDGKVTYYRYVPNTNLLSCELVYEGNSIRKRTFHLYDDCAICIKTLIDDGQTEDPQNLRGVTYRKITEITPKQKIPCFGLPEILEEKTIDPSGNEILLHKTVYTYTPFGKVLKEEHYDAKGTYKYSILNNYDDKERLVLQTNQLGSTTTFTYDANNNPTSISGPKPGQHKEITYDKANRPIRIADWQTDGTILIIEKKYDKLGRLIEEIDPCKNKTQFEYDPMGRLVKTTHPDGAIEQKEYDLFDNVIKETDALGYETLKTYNCWAQVTSIQHPDGSKEIFTYNPTGTLASHSDKNGALSQYTYDIFDHPIKTETYSSSKQPLKTTVSSWTPFQKLSETDGVLTTVYAYDFAGRKTTEQNAYRQIHYNYDDLGRLSVSKEGDTEIIEEHDPLGQFIEKRKEKAGTIQSKEEYSYDENGNRTRVINSQGVTETIFSTDNKPLSIVDTIGFVTQYRYSYDNSFIQTIIDPKGIQTLSIHDSRNREAGSLKKNTRDAIIQHYENIYDKTGNRTQLIHTVYSDSTPVNTITHHWEYGPMGRIERFLESGMRETRYLYDDKGRLQTLIKPNGRSLHHEYDDLGRLSRFYAQDFDYQYQYDQNDRVTTIEDKTCKTTTTRSYDPLGNILQETLASGLSFFNTYDTMGRRVSLKLPDSSTITYVYDGFYLYQVQRGNYTHTYLERNLEGQIAKVRLPDSEEISIERDKLGRYANYHSPYYTAFYPKNSYDGNGNLLRYQFKDPLGKTDYTFSYDDLDQLIAESDHTYQFDSLYNRLKKDELDYTIDALCQVKNDGKVAYEYDACGNLIADGIWKYSYDSLDRLISIDNGSTRIEYSYDPFNRRLSKTIIGWCFNTSTYYMWDGDNEIGIVDEKNRIQELRVLGEGLGAEIGAAILYELNGKSYIPIHDHRGCVVVLIDPKTKKPVECYRYTAFGEELTNSILSPWRFASKRVDKETDLVFFGRRYYHPHLGRFITHDPEGFEDGPNLYAYLHNCPLADFDPYGLWSWKGMWGGTKEAFWGAGSYAWDGVCGLGRCAYGIGELGYSGFQSAYFQDASYLQTRWNQSRETLGNFGKALWNDPLGIAVPGVMESWRNPTSPAAWGKAAVDIGLIGFSAAKLGRAATNFSRVGRIGEEFSISERLLSSTSKCDTFFEGTQYSSKVLRQMSKPNDIYHAFPTSVDGFATKFGTWSTKIGSDGRPYQWLEMHGSYGGKTGVFEFIKDEKGIINHRYFKAK